MKLTFVDWLIMLLYFVFVLGIGFALKRYMKTSKDFFQAGRALPAWICGLAFISANLGAQEVIGMGASGAKYGLETAHFYGIGAIPAMIFVGIFMMPFYYGSKARSVPEFLRLRFDEKTRGLNACSFAVMTVFSLAPSILMMTTCFVRFVVVLGLLRQALGNSQGLPTQVLTAICLFLTFLVMSPIWQRLASSCALKLRVRRRVRPYSRWRVTSSTQSAGRKSIAFISTTQTNTVSASGAMKRWRSPC